MKKRTKAGLIAAGACILTGVVLMGAGSIAGGYEQVEEMDVPWLWNTSVNRYYRYDDDWTDDWDDDDGIDADHDDGFHGALLEKVEGKETLSGDFARQVEYAGTLRKLEADAGAYSLLIEEGEDNAVRIRGENCDGIQCYVKDGTLYLKDVAHHHVTLRSGERKIELTVPGGIVWDKVSLDAAAGSIRIGSLNADRLEAEAAAGNIEAEQIAVRSLDVSADLGNVSLYGSLEGDAEVEASMGNVTLGLNQRADAFNYEVRAEMGTIRLDGEQFTGLDRKTTIQNRADRKMELECSMGSIEIFFEQG